MDVQNGVANRRIISADGSDQASMDTMRIFIGGLGEGVTDDDLRRMFVALGSVDEIEIIRSKGRSIAYLNFTPSSAKSLAKLFSSFNGCVWKGGKLRIEKAKEHYLLKMEKEREKEIEDEIARNDAMMKRTVEVVTLKKPIKGPGAEKEQIRVFFPKLRKVKPLPFSGCGKHKYSFRNIPVPPLPVHFCDCELHYVPYDAPVETGGVDEKEFDLMRSVLNKLISKDEDSAPDGNEGPSSVSDDILELDENAPNSEPDEDGIIINISGAMKEPDFSWRSEDKKFSEYQGSNHTHPQTFEIDDKRLPNSNRTRKLDEGINTTVDHSLKKKKDVLNAVSALPIGSNLLKAKNSKWKELVGVGTDSTFKLSNVLSRVSVQESVQSEDSEDESSMSEDLNDETDESTQDTEDESSNLEEADEAKKSTSELDKSVSEESSESEECSDELAKEKNTRVESSKSEESDDEVNEESSEESAKHEDFEDEPNQLEESDDEVEQEDIRDKSAKLDESDVVMEQESSDDTENKSDKHDESDDEVEQESSDDLQEDTEEESDKFDESDDDVAEEKDTEEALTELEQPGEKQQLGKEKLTDTEDRSVKKGATWSQVMPWTQLVSDLDNSSFSISQILPSTSENKVALKPSLEVKDRSIPQSSNAVKVESTSVSDVHLTNNNSLSAIKSKEENPTVRVNSAPKPAMRDDSYVSRPFVRCPASLKEWGKLKETLRKSGTRKRKTPEE